MRLKRYWLFTGAEYYPSGGMKDFKGSFESVGEAIAHLQIVKTSRSIEWYQILDSFEGKVVQNVGDIPYHLVDDEQVWDFIT